MGRVRVFPGVVISPIVTDRNNFYGVATEAICPVTISLEYKPNYWMGRDKSKKGV